MDSHTAEPLEALVRDAATDDDAFERLVRRCRPMIHRWAWVAAGDADQAEDVVQETLLRVHRSLGGFRDDARFTTWLYRITRSVATDLGRHSARHRRKERWFASQRDPDVGQDPPAVIPRLERERTLDLVRAFWRELPTKQRIVFDLADLQGYAPSEVAEMLEMNAATVRAHLFKARRTIRGRILANRSEAMQEEDA